MKPSEIEELRALAAQASDPPWKWHPDDTLQHNGLHLIEADARLLVAARNALPSLLEEREMLLGALKGCRASMARRGDLIDDGWYDFEIEANDAAEEAIQKAES